LPDGRRFDEAAATWRDRRGRPARWPDLVETTLLAQDPRRAPAAHLDHDPTHNRLRHLRALWHRCHMLNDRPHHLTQRWMPYRRRWAVGDLFLASTPQLRCCRRGANVAAATVAECDNLHTGFGTRRFG
jgi:hypothetical protein